MGSIWNSIRIRATHVRAVEVVFGFTDLRQLTAQVNYASGIRDGTTYVDYLCRLIMWITHLKYNFVRELILMF